MRINFKRGGVMIAGMGNDYLDRKTREQCHVQLRAGQQLLRYEGLG